MSENIRLSAVRFGADGLVPGVTQESRSGDILMFAYANRDALDRRFSTGPAHHFSRSLGTLWHRGETSVVRKPPPGSFTARAACGWPREDLGKSGRRAFEMVLAAHTEDDERLASEARGLLYHLLVLLQIRGVPLDSVWQELEKRKR